MDFDIMGLGELLASAGQSGENSGPALPLMDAQREELKIIRAQIEGKSGKPFAQWDEVTFVHRASNFKSNFVRGSVLVFWTYLSADEGFEWVAASANGPDINSLANPDCLIASVSTSTGLRFHIADSELLIPAPESVSKDVPIRPEE